MIPLPACRTGPGYLWLEKTLKRGQYNLWFILIPTGFGGPSVLNWSGIGAQVGVFLMLKLYNPLGSIYNLIKYLPKDVYAPCFHAHRTVLCEGPK